MATTSVPASAKEATTRTERGLALYRERGEHIEHVAPYVYLVPSQDGQRVYRVNYERETCTCPDNQYRGIACVHVYCVGISRAKRRARRGL